MFWPKRTFPSRGLWEACRSTYEDACISATRRAAASSLLDLQQEFEQARRRGDRQRAEDCRSAVRQAKDRLRLVLRGAHFSPEKKEVKQELLRWFLVWLETPELFSQWLELRRGAKTQR